MARSYDRASAPRFDPASLNPTVDFLASLAEDGPVLEFAIGTGRVALPLSARGLDVFGIELSPHMVDQLRAKPGADAVEVVIGDMTTASAQGSFTLVYLVWNAIMNVTTQQEQVAVFRNAANHLRLGGHFVVEVDVPQIGRVQPGELGRVFEFGDHHVGIDTFDDPIGQIATSHHWFEANGVWGRHSAPFRYIWPSEMDLMAELAGLRLHERWSGWEKEPFTKDCTEQVALYQKVA
jgi:SAM-dependent methyltransferase